MNNKELNKIEHLDKLMQSAGIEKVDSNFTDSVMDKIELLEPQVQNIQSTKIMSAWGWVLATTITFILIISAILLGTPSSAFESISSFFDKFRFEINFVQIPDTFLMSILGFIFFFIIQIRLYMYSLSRYHNRN